VEEVAGELARELTGSGGKPPTTPGSTSIGREKMKMEKGELRG
jgi:hypothetical protein